MADDLPDVGPKPPLRGDTGVLLRVTNGAVIGYDETGLILRLSDRTIADLAERLGTGAAVSTAQALDAGVLGDIDAWNLTRDGDWYRFDAMLPPYPHPRRFRRLVSGGHIIADAPGPLLAMLSLGGARRAGTLPGPGAFPAHVLAPGDDIGAVGMAGVEPAPAFDSLERLREQTADSLAAAHLLATRQAAGRALPLILARTESDESGSVDALLPGPALANLEQAMRNLVAMGRALGVPVRVASIALDFAVEDVVSDADTYVSGLRAVMARLNETMGTLGLHEPLFLMAADSSGRRSAEHWHLAVYPGDAKLCFIGPADQFDQTAQMRPTPQGMAHRAALEGAAVAAHLDGIAWRCPRLLLAEAEGAKIRVICDALGPLRIAEAHGFTLTHGDAPVEILAVEPCPDDPQALLITPALPPAPYMCLVYGIGTGGGLRDDWQQDDAQAGRLFRRALPATLPVTQC